MRNIFKLIVVHIRLQLISYNRWIHIGILKVLCYLIGMQVEYFTESSLESLMKKESEVCGKH